MLDVLLEAVVLPTPFVVGILPRRGIEGLPILGQRIHAMISWR